MKNLKKSIVFVTTILMLFVSLNTMFASNGGKSEKNDIVTTAIEAGNFTTLAKALQAANLVNALKGDGPFTVFAPTDEAFAKLPDGALENLIKDKEALKNVLLYHVVSGKVTSDEVVKLSNAKTMSGKLLNIDVKNGKVMINQSKVTNADIKTSNGVIHIIDTVLMPE